MLKKTSFLFILSLQFVSALAQHNYIAFDHSVFQFRDQQACGSYTGLAGNLERSEGNFEGASIQIACGRKHYIGVGAGISKISYRKQWMGIFSESSQFGAALVDGRIEYWSFPITYTWNAGNGPRTLNRWYRKRKDVLQFGLCISYIPSFEAKHSFTVTTSGGAGAGFVNGFHGNEQGVQQGLLLSINDQLFLFDKLLRVDLEPYAGIGSGYFKESGTSIGNLCYGLKVRVCLRAKLPEISIEREVYRGDEQKKKDELKKKQEEIEQQLKKQPN